MVTPPRSEAGPARRRASVVGSGARRPEGAVWDWAPEAVSCRALPWRGSSSPHLCYGRQLPLLLTDEKT